MPRPLRHSRPAPRPMADRQIPFDTATAPAAGLPRWRGLYVVEPEPRDIDGVLALRGTRWHAETRLLAAFAQGMRRLL